MKKIQLLYLLVLIYAITSKKYSRDNLRKSIDKHNFGKTQEINIPTSVKSIGDETFKDCKNLKKINIPNSVKSIGERAFCYCDSLTSLTLENGIKTICEKAFLDCEKLKSVTVPVSVKSIGEYALGYEEEEMDVLDYENIYENHDNIKNEVSILKSAGNPVFLILMCLFLIFTNVVVRR